MPWQQISAVQFERPFDTLELLYRNIASSTAHLHKQHYLIASAVKLRLQPAITDLQLAWTKLRYEHPKIATVPDETGTRLVYTVPSEQEIEKWIVKTFHIHTTDDTSAETLDASLPPSTDFMLHYIASTQELLFRSPHWRIDGIGMILLENRFLDLLSKVSSSSPVFDGSEVCRLPPGLDEAAGFSLDITGGMKSAAEGELSVFATGASPLSIQEATEGITTPGASRRFSTWFSKDTSAKIIAGSKNRGLKVTTAVQAALFLTARQYISSQEGVLMCFNTYNLRDYLPKPWNGTQGATGVYHTGRPFSVDLGLNRDYEAFSSSLRAHYEESIESLFDFMIPYMQSVEKLLAAPFEVAINLPGAAHPEMSSLGIIDDRLQNQFHGINGTVEIDDWWLGVHVVNRLLQTYLWTRDGELNLSCHYNQAFYSCEFVQQFCEGWKATLLGEFISESQLY